MVIIDGHFVRGCVSFINKIVAQKFPSITMIQCQAWRVRRLMPRIHNVQRRTQLHHPFDLPSVSFGLGSDLKSVPRLRSYDNVGRGCGPTGVVVRLVRTCSVVVRFRSVPDPSAVYFQGKKVSNFFSGACLFNVNRPSGCPFPSWPFRLTFTGERALVIMQRVFFERKDVNPSPGVKFEMASLSDQSDEEVSRWFPTSEYFTGTRCIFFFL